MAESELESEFQNEDQNQNQNEDGLEESENEDPVQTSVAPALPPNSIDLTKVIQLGDRLIIDSEANGFVVGTVYYRSESLVRIKPDGASNVLIDFPRTYDERRDEFVSELGVKATYILKKRLFPDFIRQQDFRLGQTITGITETGQEIKYSLTKLNPDEDSIVLTDSTAAETEFLFSHVGINPELDIRILKITGAPKPRELAEVPEEEAKEEEEAAAAGEDEDEEVLPSRRFKVRVLGTVQLPKIKTYKEETNSKLIIPQAIQKSDALNDMIGMLDPDLQRDAAAQRQIRIMVETMFHMKQALIEYNEDGTIKGQKDISPKSLVDLIRLSKNDIPLGRAVLNISKRLYKDPEEAEEDEGAPGFETVGITFVDEATELARMTTDVSAPVASVVHTAEGQMNLIEHYNTEQRYYGSFERPWTAISESDPIIEHKKDISFFRLSLPDLTEPDLNGFKKAAPKPSPREPQPHPALGKLAMGMERALTTTFRKGTRSGKQMLLEAEEATVLYYLLFPQTVARNIGSTRSGQSSLDSVRGLSSPQSMLQILTRLGGIQDEPTPQTILALGVEGSTLGNIPIVDYLRGLNIPGMGLGDTMTTLQDFGLGQFEFSEDLLKLLVEKLTTYQNQLKATLLELRQTITSDAEAAQEPTPNPMLPLTSPILSDLPLDDAILAEDIATFKSKNPVLQKSDIALVAYMLRTHADYYQAVIGGQPLLIAEANLAVRRSIRMATLELERRLKERKADVGEVPVPNLCEHVANLRTIRKIKDEQERYYYLTKFFANYQGKRREDNWIDCRICNKELLCVHERLMIQAYLNPLDKAGLLKQINLNFSGGVFQGHYICRACGQPIQEIGYDTNLQFDDEGRPMSGRAELVDKDALSDREIEIAMGVAFAPEEEVPFAGDQLVYYKIVRLLAERVGIYMDYDRYRVIIGRIESYLSSLPSLAAYSESQEERRKAAAAAGTPFRAGNYNTLISRNTVCAAAMFLLIEIQTHIPDYQPKFTLPNCVAGFAGYPLTGALDGENEGITYMACNVGTIGTDEPPWNLTGYQGVKNREKRLAAIMGQIKLILTDTMSGNPLIQREIIKKNLYLLGLQGKREGEELSQLTDIVPVGFLPELVVPVGAAETVEEGAFNAAAAAAAAAAAGNNRGIAKAWIHEGHLLAKTTANIIKGSLFSDITCCKVNITTPGQFWEASSSLPALPERRITPLLRARSQQVHFKPRSDEGGVIEIDQDKTYVLFLKFCFAGDRLGYPHEPGLTNLCAHCGFQFPGHPSVVDPGEGKLAIKAVPELDTSLEGFQGLLDTVHRHNEIEAYRIPLTESFDTVLIDFANIDPPPFSSWKDLFTTTLQSLRVLAGASNTLNRGELVEALAPLSNRVGDAEEAVKSRLNPKITKLVDTMADFSWHRYIQVVETYLVVPIQKILSKFFLDSDVPNYDFPKEFSSDHKTLLNKVVDNDNGLVKAFLKQKSTLFMKNKLHQYLKQMSALLTFKDRLRMELFPGQRESFQYIQQAFLFGPLAELFDSSIIPPELVESIVARARAGAAGAAGAAAGAAAENDNPQSLDSARAEASAALSRASVAAGEGATGLLVKLMNAAFMKFSGEQLVFNDEQLREIIQARNEKELRRILDRKTRMSDEERYVDGMLQSRGMGEWAVIRADLYNPNQFDIEREQNAEAGIDEGLYGLNFGELGLGENEGDGEGYDHGWEAAPEFEGEDN